MALFAKGGVDMLLHATNYLDHDQSFRTEVLHILMRVSRSEQFCSQIAERHEETVVPIISILSSAFSSGPSAEVDGHPTLTRADSVIIDPALDILMQLLSNDELRRYFGERSVGLLLVRHMQLLGCTACYCLT